MQQGRLRNSSTILVAWIIFVFTLANTGLRNNKNESFKVFVALVVPIVLQSSYTV